MNQVLCISTTDGGRIKWDSAHPQIGDILQPISIEMCEGIKSYIFEQWPCGFGVECFVELLPVSEINLKSEACAS